MRWTRWALAASGVALAGSLLSCASGGGVDATPTLRTSVDAHLGKGWTSDSTRVENLTTDFSPTDVVHAIVDVPTKIDGTIRVVWMRGTDILEEKSRGLEPGANVYPYRLFPPAGGHPVGDYTFEVYINGNRAEAESFKVVAS